MSVILQGYRKPPRVLTWGYGSSLLLRETFTVPLPDGVEAQRASGAQSRAPYVGSLEQGIAFGLDFLGWLDPSEGLSGVTATVRAEPTVGGRGPAADVTSSVLAGTTAAASLATVTLQHAVAKTVYVVTVSAQTTAGRILECRMPPIWCPD